MKKIIINLIVGFVFGFLALWFIQTSVYGQERTLIYRYDNFHQTDTGNGKGQLIVKLATRFQLYEAGDTLINVSSWGEIKWTISGKENWKAIRIGDGSVFRSEYEVFSDSSIHDYDTDFDLSMNGDTTFFSKNGKVILINYDVKVFDHLGNPLAITDIKIKDKKVKYKFNRPDKSKKVKVDPTWSWQAVGIPDAWILSANPTTTYNDVQLISGVDGSNGHYKFLILFPGWQDSLDALLVGGQVLSIDSAKVRLVNWQTTNSPSAFLARIPGEGGGFWSETTVNHNNAPDSLTPYSDILDFSDTGTRDFNVTSIIDTIYSNSLIDSGFIALIVNGASNNLMYFRSSAFGSNEPTILIYYTLSILPPPPIAAFIAFGDTSDLNFGVVEIDSIDNSASGNDINRIALLFDNGLWYKPGGYPLQQWTLDSIYYALSLFDEDSLVLPDGKIRIRVFTNNDSGTVDTLQVYKHGDLDVLFADSSRTSGVAGEGVTAATLADSMLLTLKLLNVRDSLNAYNADSNMIKYDDNIQNFRKMK